MDFMTIFPKTSTVNVKIWFVMDRLTKSAYFILIKINYLMQKLVEVYIERIDILYGIPSSIISDGNLRLTSRLWEVLQEALGTKLWLSYVYHPQTDSQTEKTI